MVKSPPLIRLFALFSGALFLILPIKATQQAVAKGLKTALPAGFSYLYDVDSTILQDIRYATRNNFTGKVLPGYRATECVLRREVARALSLAQKNLLARGYSLKVYDCYRPTRAVRAFGVWAHDLKEHETKDYYPRLPKSKLYGKGYIARRSTHSIGYTVDLTLVRLPAQMPKPYDPTRPRKPCTAPYEQRPFDNGIDMGTGFDCFDTKSHTANRSLSQKVHTNRRLLQAALHQAGFANYRREWWHYSYIKRKYRRRYLDFPILPHPQKASTPRRQDLR